MKKTMTTILVQFFFGWPAIIATLLLVVAGLVWKRWWLLLIAAALFFPVSLYLSGYPAIRGFGFLLPVFLLGAAFAARARKRILAWLLAAPVFIVSAWLAVVVITQRVS
jgi:hypothetical protein